MLVGLTHGSPVPALLETCCLGSRHGAAAGFRLTRAALLFGSFGLIMKGTGSP